MGRLMLTVTAVIGAALVLLVCGAVAGGWWAGAALIYITLAIAALDTTTALDLPGGGQAQARVLSIALGWIHFGILGGVVAALTLADHSLAAKIGLFAAAGLYLGQVSNSNAHDLIHAPDSQRRRLGRWNYITLLYGHHVSAHPGVHHVHVATPLDPNSARLNEGYWKFLPRCWIGAFRAGLALEMRRLASKGLPPWHRRNPYWAYCGGALACLGLAFATLGVTGAAIYAGLCLFAQSQLIVSDYVQHYGLRRRQLAGGGYEPLGPQHAWDAPHWASSALMLNAPRHADHHLNPSRGFEALRMADGSARLPCSLPVMAVLALWPDMWRRVMAPRARAVMDATGTQPYIKPDRQPQEISCAPLP
jgi:alkane 1-monooxygenase